MPSLGPWSLVETLAETPRSALWIAEHRHQEVPACLRIAKQRRDTRSREAWLAANRRPAMLDHANVVHHFDHGVCGTGEHEGAPYIVTELVADGSAADVLGRLKWHEVRRILVGVLDGLCHAHARGVFHLDLRPSKVLLDGGAPRLTGFGMRWVRTERDDPPDLTGDAHYLAPEQCEGRWRDWGAPTDLYAVGCLTWALVTGKPPFTEDVLQSHLVRSPGRLPVDAKVPMGLSHWLERALAKNPGQRFANAADALWLLSTLGPTDSTTIVGEFDRAEAETQPIPDLDDEAETHINRRAARSIRGPDLPPIPEGWDRLAPRRDAKLHGAGLSLWPLRARPIGGRKDVRDALWAGLRVVDRGGTARLTILRGGMGMGKSTLARWLSERARELGAANAMVATHAHPAGRHDGLRGMLDRHLGCVGLRRGAVARRMQRLLLSEGIDDPALADAMAELIRPATPHDEGVRRFADPSERYDTLLALLRVLTARRPLVLLMLDVQWGLGLLPLLKDLLERQEGQPVPVYVVLTLDESSLQADPRLREEVDALGMRPEVETLSLGPMRGREWQPFADTLRLRSDLSAHLARSTNGNPLFTQQLVADWVQQGVVRMGPNGLELAASGGQVLPKDLPGLWRRRLERLLEGLPPTDAQALEIAAALGKEVDEAEWLDACLRADCEPSAELTDRLFAQRLARPGAEGFRFEHHDLRRALVERARAARRWEVHNAVCAELLADERQPLRRAMHLIEAGEARRAVGPLGDAIERARRGADYILAHRLLEDRRRALEGLSRDLSAWGEQAVLEQLVADSERVQTGPLFNAPALLGRAVRSGWVQLVPRLERIWGDQLLVSEDLVEARAVLLDAGLRARMLGDHALEGRCLATLALGVPTDEAGPLWYRALALFEQGKDLAGAANALDGLCQHLVAAGRHAEVLERAPRLRKAGQRAGYPRLEASGWLHEGDARRRMGDPTEALACYRHARRLWPGGLDLPAYREGLAYLDRGDYGDARERFETCMPTADSDPKLMAALQMGVLPGLAEASAWTAYDDAFRRGERLLWQTGAQDPDIGLSVRLAGDLALENGSRDRARRAYELARDQLKAVGLGDELATVEEVLQRLR